MPKRRKSRRAIQLKAAPILWSLFLINTAVGIGWSTATAVRKVRVVGALPTDQARIAEHLSQLRGVPCAQVDATKLESYVLAGNEVQSAVLTRNPFGRAILRVKNRVPVARIDVKRPIYLSDQGSLFQSVSNYPGLPKLRIPPDGFNANLALMGSLPAGKIAELCKILPRSIKATDYIVELDGRGVICLGVPPNGRVVLGSTRKLNEKLDQFEKLLTERPNLFTKISELNLMAPERPYYVPLANESKPKP